MQIGTENWQILSTITKPTTAQTDTVKFKKKKRTGAMFL